MTKTNQVRLAIFVVGIILLCLSMFLASLSVGIASGSLLEMNIFLLTIATLLNGIALPIYSVVAPKRNIDNLFK